jgi:hypothetical protein
MPRIRNLPKELIPKKQDLIHPKLSDKPFDLLSAGMAYELGVWDVLESSMVDKILTSLFSISTGDSDAKKIAQDVLSEYSKWESGE